jgi:hypothetical protein
MKTFDIKSSMPIVSVAMSIFENVLKITRKSEKVIKIIHGYGSSGKGGAIKARLHQLLETKLAKGEIKAFIPGEAIYTPMGFDSDIALYKHLLVGDSDFNKGNDGITYVIFKQ